MALTSYRMAVTPDDMRGYVYSIYRLGSYGAEPLGTALCGLGLGLIGPRIEILIADLSTIAVNKPLLRSKGGLMCLLRVFEQRECVSKLFMQTFGTITSYFQTAALEWAVRRESGDDNMSPRRNGMAYLTDVFLSVGFACEAVEDGTIMPESEVLERKGSLGNVGRHPPDGRRLPSKPCLRYVQRGIGNIQDGEVLKTCGKQIVYKP